MSTLCVLVLCVCISFGWLRKAVDRQKLANDVRQLGGTVQYWDPDVSKPPPSFAKRMSFRITQILTGDPYYGRQPIHVSVNSPNELSGGGLLRRITNAFPKLESLRLVSVELSSSSIDTLAQLKALKGLTLSTCRLSEDVFATMPTLHNLERANLRRSELSDDAVSDFVRACPKLKSINLQGNGLANAFLDALRKQYPELSIHYPPLFRIPFGENTPSAGNSHLSNR